MPDNPAPNSNYLSLWGWNGQGQPPIDDPSSDFWQWWNTLGTNPFSAGTSYQDMLGGGGKPAYDPGWQTIADLINGSLGAIPPLLGGGGTEPTVPEQPTQPADPTLKDPNDPGRNTGPEEEPPTEGSGIDWGKLLPPVIGGGLGAVGGILLGSGGEVLQMPDTGTPKFDTTITEPKAPDLTGITPPVIPNVPYDPAVPQYPELPKNPDFTTWPWDTPPQVPYDPAPIDYGGITPPIVPGMTAPPLTPTDPKTPEIKAPTITPTVSGSGGGLGGAALPPGFPVVGDNSKMKSIFDLPVSMVPLNFIKALQLGGRR